MCGICGDIRRPGRDSPNRRVIAEMNDLQAHRGPDGEGILIDGNAGFGHRRLSILDLSESADQPMSDPETGVLLTFNGEIYNYVEIRSELKALGHRFKSSGDTEVLLRAYLEWGTEVVSHLSGMFAFAIYDQRRQMLFAARDPKGQKPFFYHCGPDGFVFASELTALMAHPDMPRSIDRDSLVHYLVFESFPAPQTPLQGVKKLPPGHCLSYRPNDNDIKTWPFWENNGKQIKEAQLHAPDLPTDADFERLENVLRRSVNRHLRSDVPVGVFLSGGIDSSTLAILACDILGAENVRTFTVASSEPSFNEADEARATAEYLGTQHHETTLRPEQALETVPHILNRLDEPLSDPGLIAIYQVADFASQHVKVVLSGDGGDEFLYGYPPFAKWNLAEFFEKFPLWLKRGLLSKVIDGLPAQYGYMGTFYKAKLFSRGFGRPAATRNSAWIGSFLPNELCSLLINGQDMAMLQPDDEGIEPVYAGIVQTHNRFQDLDPLARLAFEYQDSYLPNCICSHTDKANMMHSLEARAPFLDPELMNYFNSMPSSWKLHKGKGKWILREYLGRRQKNAVAKKPKQGFTVPLAIWLRKELKGLGDELLDSDLIAAGGLFDPSQVRRLWNEHQTGKENHYKKLWTLIVFQAWWRRHFA